MSIVSLVGDFLSSFKVAGFSSLPPITNELIKRSGKIINRESLACVGSERVDRTIRECKGARALRNSG